MTIIRQLPQDSSSLRRRVLFGWGFCFWSLPAIALLARFWFLEST
jgi:hypothetical protein